MTEEQKNQIQRLRSNGMGYSKIAQMLRMSENTVKSYCRRKGLGGVARNKDNMTNVCECCGIEIMQTPGKRKKRFCSDKCRSAWWNHHPAPSKGRKREYTCAFCGGTFHAYADRKYCCHPCYIKSRFGDYDETNS